MSTFNFSSNKLNYLYRESHTPSTNEIKEFITDEVVIKKVLSRQLAAVNQQTLKQTGSLEKLVEFVQESFKVSWRGKDLSAIKSLDYMTKNLTIPSRSGRNFCNKLSVSYLFFSFNTYIYLTSFAYFTVVEVQCEQVENFNLNW